MRSASEEALGQPRETKPTVGTFCEIVMRGNLVRTGRRTKCVFYRYLARQTGKCLFQRVETLRVDGRADVLGHDLQRLRDRYRDTVGKFGGNRVEDVGGRDEPGFQADI